MTDPGPRWRIATPSSAPGALAAIELIGEEAQIDQVMVRLGIPPVGPGRIALRNLAGVDTGLLARWTGGYIQFMPHGGPLAVRELAALLNGLGLVQIEHPTPAQLRSLYPEAADEFEHRMLQALAGARSPRALDLLLDQPRRWRLHAAGSLPGPDQTHSRILGRLLEPPVVAAIGASNIGKSSLVNALAGRPVSIVADEPGTTRDHVGVLLDVGGLVVRYIDMPGERSGAGPLESQAALAAAGIVRSADLVLRCGDTASEPPGLARAGSAGAIIVALRSDLGTPSSWRPDAITSARSGAGIEELADLIRSRLVPDDVAADPRPWRFWAGA